MLFLTELWLYFLPFWHGMIPAVLKDLFWSSLHFISSAHSNPDVPSQSGAVSECSYGITRARIFGKGRSAVCLICSKLDLLPHMRSSRSLVVTFVYFLLNQAPLCLNWSMKTVGRLPLQREGFLIRVRLCECGCVLQVLKDMRSWLSVNCCLMSVCPWLYK